MHQNRIYLLSVRALHDSGRGFLVKKTAPPTGKWSWEDLNRQVSMQGVGWILARSRVFAKYKMKEQDLWLIINGSATRKRAGIAAHNFTVAEIKQAVSKSNLLDTSDHRSLTKWLSVMRSMVCAHSMNVCVALTE